MALVNYWKTRGLMLIGAILCWMLGVGITKFLGFPAAGQHQASLLLQPNPAIALGVVLVGLVVAAIVGLLVAGRVRSGAGVFCAVFILAAISWHSGAMHDVLFVAPEANTYFKLAAETLILGLFIGLLQFLVHTGVSSGRLHADASRDGYVPDADDRNLKGDATLAVLLTAAAYVLIAFFLIPVDDKKQAMVGVACAAFAATAAIHYFILPTVAGWPFWAGIMLGAFVSFAYSGIAPGIPSIGVVDFPPARALPIDHASAGVAASLAAYWYSRKWRHAELSADTETA